MKGIQYCGYKLSYDILIMGNRYIKGYSSTIFGYGLASFFLYGVTKELYFKYICKNSIDNDINNNNDTNNDNKNKVIPYTLKYYDKFNNLPNKELSKEYIKSLLTNIVFETTPKGNIIMYYDYHKESFIYYCDVRYIPYLYLETVARKYAINFNCKKLVVDIKKEIEYIESKNKKIIEKQNEKNKENNKENNKDNNKNTNMIKKDSDIFASFKSYRVGNSNSSSSSSKKKYVVPESANMYSYYGKIKEYNFIKKNDYKIEKPLDKLDYKTFKNMEETNERNKKTKKQKTKNKQKNE